MEGAPGPETTDTVTEVGVKVAVFTGLLVAVLVRVRVGELVAVLVNVFVGDRVAVGVNDCVNVGTFESVKVGVTVRV